MSASPRAWGCGHALLHHTDGPRGLAETDLVLLGDWLLTLHVAP